MMPMNPTGPPTETAAPVASEALKNASALRARHVEAARAGALGAEAEQVQRPRAATRRSPNETTASGSAVEDRLVAADVEIPHQPAQDPERLREVREVLHEQDQRREERVHRDAGEQQHVGREAAVARARERVDDRRRRASEPAKLAAGTAGMPAHANVQPNVIASIAPSAAPADTPSVNGVASGLRSSPWKTTPADASIAPTSAPASVRGSRAMKKICASTLSANGIAEVEGAAQADAGRSDERREHDGADRERPEHRERRREPPAERRRHRPRLRGCARAERPTSRPAGCRCDLGFDAVERPDRLRRQDVRGRPCREHAPAAQQHERAAQRRGEVEVVRRDDDRHRDARLEIAQERGDLELVGEIERRRRLVEEQHRVSTVAARRRRDVRSAPAPRR